MYIARKQISFALFFILLMGKTMSVNAVDSFEENQDYPPLPEHSEDNEEISTDDTNADTSLDAEISNSGMTLEKKERNLAEDPNKAYHSVGARLRWLFIPKWFVTMFGVDAQSPNMGRPMISNIGIGAEYTYRKDSFDITAAFWYAQLDWDGTISFKGKNESVTSWEVVTNSLQALLFTADFIWSSPIRDWVAITYGVGIGLGISIGEITRTEATVASGGLLPCAEAGAGGDPGCQAEGEYNVIYDKIPVIPWINLLIGARFKPHEHVAVYVDGGFGMGFQMGLRVGYIF